MENQQIFRQTIPSHISLPQAFRRAGYFAARIGKLYHYNVPRSVGTSGHDDPGSWELELNPVGVDRLEEEPEIFTLTPGSFGGTLSWYASPKEDRFHTDGMIAADADWVLERCARDRQRPFFLAVGFFRPHTPYVSPKKYFELFPEEAMPLVGGVEESLVDVPEAALLSRKRADDLLTDDLRRQCIQAYRAAITFMDAQLGVVLDALDRHELADDTIVVFTSDHGYHMGEHGLWQKRSLFEESARVPLILAGPGIEKNAVSKAPVGLVDLYPTLAELCSVPAPDNLQGQSLAPMLKDSSVEGRGWSLSQVTRGGQRNRYFGYSLRTPRYRYTEWDEGKKGRELYDHENDPKEQVNLAHRPTGESAALIEELSATLRKAAADTYPDDGQIPRIRSAVWAPNLTDP